jgi:hypothetical protein
MTESQLLTSKKELVCYLVDFFVQTVRHFEPDHSMRKEVEDFQRELEKCQASTSC